MGVGCLAAERTERLSMGVVTLLTDFGLKDWFVGVMKGVMLDINPSLAIVDVTHAIPAGDIPAGAFALAAAFRYFPSGTIHVSVVDPGVGSQRLPIILQTEHYSFVGPDNGLLSLAASQDRIKSIYHISNPAYWLPSVSQTFHGRDIFAPVAAHLSKGVAPASFGPVRSECQRLSMPAPAPENGAWSGCIVYVDQFGNAVTNLAAAAVQAADLRRLRVRLPGHGPDDTSLPVGAFYQSVQAGMPLALLGSTGYLEVAVNGGSAVKELGLRVGDRVILEEVMTTGIGDQPVA